MEPIHTMHQMESFFSYWKNIYKMYGSFTEAESKVFDVLCYKLYDLYNKWEGRTTLDMMMEDERKYGTNV